ncbi:serine/threonine-protein kinase [Pseudonocardia asaccharolytica]|uniref:Protein kinase domain-containing protein n=1 Tax=Pseudonocardia asaccharolytica DSM 44247 = NBRC 16224 TaxID=1123024 RepID=A0A511D5B3_9PSEU|nr:serine/threonine-protein kinase [Pseudonocardia asaccharolytica]GEL19837.1 hypothetical protein PA7_36740 [Pseudonocardia asaccharolytica DSM 44247 = NBRC 16224]
MTGSGPRTVGPFTILRMLGEGGMGRVYLGRSRDGALAAVKVIRADLAGDAEFRARFRQEVAAASRVRSARTAAVLGADPEAASPWLATEYVPAPSLREAVAAQGPMAADAIRQLGIGLAEALVAIHRAGVVHRDLKPGNVLLGTDGPRVIDFGIARAADATVLTRTGAIIGSPGYIAPEQLAHGHSGPASDVFALGGLLLHAATGRGPFGEGDAATLLYRALHVEPDLSGVPAPLTPIIAACLDRDPSRRPSPEQLRDALAGNGLPDRPPPTLAAAPEAPARGPAPRWHRAALVTGVVATLAVLVGVGLWALRGPGSSPGPQLPTWTEPPSAVPTSAVPVATLVPTSAPVTTAPADVQVASAATGFSTPSNNIACYLSPNSARCDIAEHSWDPDRVPNRPDNCPLVWGDSLSVTGSDRAEFVCHGDTVFGTGPILDYGRSLRVGDVTCTSRTAGVECRVGASGHGFSMSKSGYQFF